MDRSPAVNLVFVEFQYTTCLLAAAAEIMLIKKIVAFQAGRAPGVQTREPILCAAGAAERLCAGWEWRANQVRRPGAEELGEQLSSSSFTNT